MSDTGEATWKLVMSVSLGATTTALWVAWACNIFIDGQAYSFWLSLVFGFLTIAMAGLVAAALRSTIRLVFEMRDEYCFDCNCECNLDDEGEAEPEVSADLQRFPDDDPNNPGVKMYPSVS